MTEKKNTEKMRRKEQMQCCMTEMRQWSSALTFFEKCHSKMMWKLASFQFMFCTTAPIVSSTLSSLLPSSCFSHLAVYCLKKELIGLCSL